LLTALSCHVNKLGLSHWIAKVIWRESLVIPSISDELIINKLVEGHEIPKNKVSTLLTIPVHEHEWAYGAQMNLLGEPISHDQPTKL
jgi:hypothetical protein